MSSSVVKSCRFPAKLYYQVNQEAARLHVSASAIVRNALRTYFDREEQQRVLQESEKRVMARVDAQGERLGQLIAEILKLAEPQ